MIKYLGSKLRLLPRIVSLTQALPDVNTVVDLFSGTSRVGHALKGAGYRVLANDHNAYAATLGRCLVQADAEDVLADAERLVLELQALPPRPGYFTEQFCEKARFFKPDNGARIDAIRERIATLSLAPELEAVLLTSLMLAADRVDSTTGVHMAYLKKWAPRAHNDLVMKVPAVLPRAQSGKGEAHMLDAEAAAGLVGDLAYLDPPYNQHKYLGNYHIWETLVRWDKPDVYGMVNKRIDCKLRRSDFNSKPRIRAALARTIDAVACPRLLVSFNNEGHVRPDEMIALLRRRGVVTVFSKEVSRYVGARIGIHSPTGDRVGQVSHLKAHELLFLVTPEPPPPALLAQATTLEF